MNDSNLLRLFNKYKNKGIFIDTGILLLYVVGSDNPALVKKFSRTANFDENDFILVSKFIDNFKSKITSPHILTEVSDLLGENEKNNFHIILQTYINGVEEKLLTSKEIAASESFLKFGLADSAIIENSKETYLIFTADNRFYGYLTSTGIDAVNFDSLKSAYP